MDTSESRGIKGVAIASRADLGQAKASLKSAVLISSSNQISPSSQSRFDSNQGNLCAMEQPALEKFVLAKLRLPDDIKQQIRRYLPAIPTPTARLIKSLGFESSAEDETVVYSRGGAYFKRRFVRASWTPPPMWPKILYKESVQRYCTYGRISYDKFTGEPAHIYPQDAELLTMGLPFHRRLENMPLTDVQALERRVQALMPPVVEA
jgi:hypothetical protein